MGLVGGKGERGAGRTERSAAGTGDVLWCSSRMGCKERKELRDGDRWTETSQGAELSLLRGHEMEEGDGSVGHVTAALGNLLKHGAKPRQAG